MRLQKLYVFAGITLMVLAATSAGAAPIFYSTVAGNVSHARSGVEDVYNALEYGVDSLGPLTAEGTSAVAWSSVTDGELHAYARNDGGISSASAFAGFFDTLMITSESLAVGAPARLLVEIDLSYTLEGGTCSAIVQGFVDGPTGRGRLAVSDGAGDCGSADYTVSEPFVGVVGQEFALNAYLTAAVGAFTPGAADASHTLRFFLTPLDDFTYTAASGRDYSRPGTVPEPATVVMCGLGMSLLAARRRRRTARA